MNLLIVSRRDKTRAFVRGALGPAYIAEDADDGIAALARARDDGLDDDGLDLVIADETTEPYGAFGLSRELKLLPEAPSVIILLERAQDVWLARWSGADRWLVQPIDPFELAAAAREVTQTPVAIDPDAGSETPEPVAG